MQNCDVRWPWARFDDRVIGNPKHFAQNERKIIHIDIDRRRSPSACKVDVPDRRRREGRADQMIGMILKPGAQARRRRLADWWKQIDGWRRRD